MPGRMSQLLSGLRSVGDYTTERQKSMADLRATQQREQMNAQGIEQNAFTLDQMRKKIADSQKLGQIMAQGGDPNAIYKRVLSEVGPEAAMEYKKFVASEEAVQLEKKQGMRNEAMQSATLMENKPGVSPQVPMAPTQEAAIPQSLDGTLGPTPAQVTTPGMRTIDAVAAQNAPVTIPGVYGPDTSITPQTRQQNDLRAAEMANEAAVRTRETQRAQQQAEMEFAPPVAEKALPSAAAEYEYAKTQGYKGTFQQYQNEDANRKRAVVGGATQEPLVAVMGPDGQPVLMKRSEAEGKRPASTREQGRAVPAGEAGKIADFQTSLNDLAKLRTTIPAGATGNMAKAGAMLPDFVTNITGWGTEAKQKQAVIDRVKQVIGKALEGGVLRKEDEYKYEKILPKLADSAEVVESKLADLDSAIALRKQTALENLEDAGYDVSKFVERSNSRTGGGKTLDDATAMKFLSDAGGDKDAARAAAKAAGYTWN